MRSAPKTGEVERAGLLDEQEERERERRVAEGVHDERLLAGRDGARALVPEVDQQVRGEADHAPAGEQEQQVARPGRAGASRRRRAPCRRGSAAPRRHRACSRRRTRGSGSRRPRRSSIMKTDSGSTTISKPTLQLAGREPGPERRDVDALLRVLACRSPRRHVAPRQTKRHADAAGREQPGLAAADPVPGEGDRARRRPRGREERDPGRGDHQLSPSACSSLSTSSSTLLRGTSPRSARGRRRPRRRRRPSRRARRSGRRRSRWRANAIRARLPALSMISSARRTISGLRRTSTPTAPVAKRIDRERRGTRRCRARASVARRLRGRRLLDRLVASPRRGRARVPEPSTTPPTAPTSRMIDVTSNASR